MIPTQKNQCIDNIQKIVQIIITKSITVFDILGAICLFKSVISLVGLF